MSILKNDSKVSNLTRYNFYSNYNGETHDYCPIVHPNRTRFRYIYYKLQGLGELQDFLTALQLQSEPIAQYHQLIDLIGGMLEDGWIESLFKNELGKSTQEIRDYFEEYLDDVILFNVAYLITKVTKLINSLTSEIESELGLPIAAIDLIISSFSEAKSQNFSHPTLFI